MSKRNSRKNDPTTITITITTTTTPKPKQQFYNKYHDVGGEKDNRETRTMGDVATTNTVVIVLHTLGCAPPSYVHNRSRSISTSK
jgi:hypothetical protein